MASVVEKVKSTVGSSGLKRGSKLPSVLLKEDNPEKGIIDLSSLQGKILIVSVPGAFSPACSSQAPGYVENADRFAEKGIQGIYIIAVNDVFVTQAWKESLHSKNPIVHFLADDQGEFTRAADMDFDATGFFGQPRSQRYVAIVEHGTVREVFVEDEAPSVTVTSGDHVLKALGPEP